MAPRTWAYRIPSERTMTSLARKWRVTFQGVLLFWCLSHHLWAKVCLVEMFSPQSVSEILRHIELARVARPQRKVIYEGEANQASLQVHGKQPQMMYVVVYGKRIQLRVIQSLPNVVSGFPQMGQPVGVTPESPPDPRKEMRGITRVFVWTSNKHCGVDSEPKHVRLS